MEIALVISALALGFASGFHCIGMCGPIALSLGLTKSQAINYYLQNLTYQFGRIVSYSFLGVNDPRGVSTFVQSWDGQNLIVGSILIQCKIEVNAVFQEGKIHSSFYIFVFFWF